MLAFSKNHNSKEINPKFETSPIQRLINLLILLQSLVPLKLHRILLFLRYDQEILFQKLEILVPKLNLDQLECLIAYSNVISSDRFLEDDSEFIQCCQNQWLRNLTSKERYSFKFLIDVYQIQKLIVEELNHEQLISLSQLVPDSSDGYQFQMVQLLQQLLSQLLTEQLQSLHEEIIKVSKPEEQSRIISLIELNPEHNLLYQPLINLLRMNLEDILKIHQILPTLLPQQLIHLLRLIRLDPFEILEIRQSLSPDGAWKGLQSLIPQSNEQQNSQQNNEILSLRIIDHPSDKIVYRRNLKPNPSVLVSGDDRNICAPGQHLAVVPVLIRCDDMSQIDKLVGNQPIAASAGEVVTFRKLKITITSHQMQETMFVLRFELRKYNSPNNYEIISFTQTKPLNVLSHTTQMKNPISSSTTVNEVIPNSGPIQGGTKVAILGKSFVESDTVLARFDDMCVHTKFHGPSTLICTTPKHSPGEVLVHVTNDGINWSKTGATFTYLMNEEKHDGLLVQNSNMMEDYTKNVFQPNFNQNFNQNFGKQNQYSFGSFNSSSNNSNPTIFSPNNSYGNTEIHFACEIGDYDKVFSLVNSNTNLINAQNNDGISPLHIACANQFDNIVSFLLMNGANIDCSNIDGQTPLHISSLLGNLNILNELLMFGGQPNIKDDEGDSSVHWAVRSNNYEVVKLLVSYGASINIQNDDGETPLHLASILCDSEMVDLLVSFGAITNITDKLDFSPLSHAISEGYSPLVNKLKPITPDISIKQKFEPIYHFSLVSKIDEDMEIDSISTFRSFGNFFGLTTVN